ncbi:TRAP transporter substrate-binding protein [Bordetella petrii]|uniref:TRAP transporter substrate-binding protein n=1 Tax=Bordetella petrii TaxID=94624 RepID=UPI001E5252C9|nr:TRAP transporter substrate-binding protein [Bordetella petrii]MCD0502302.1 TRAP transporter substrate-binding protein [Bordetella petrii]
MKAHMLVAGLAIVGLACTFPAHAEQKKVIKLGWTTTDGVEDPYAIGARAFKTALEADPDGKVFDVQLYPNRQLGDEKALLEGVRMGLAQAGIITNAVIAQIEPAYQLNDLPFLYSSAEQAYHLMEGDIGKKLSAKLEKKGILPLGYMGGGFRNMINNVRPVAIPNDVAGVKYRVMQSPMYIGMYKALGGSPVPMAWGETFTAIQQGALDGLEIPLSVIDSTKAYEITKYLSLTQHTFSVISLVFNKRWVEKLEPAQRAAVMRAADDATREQRKAVEESAKKLAAALEEKGMVLNKVGDPSAFRTKVQPVYDEFRSVIGGDIMDAALAQVK